MTFANSWYVIPLFGLLITSLVMVYVSAIVDLAKAMRKRNQS